ncbi:hypothetical protein HK102_009080, partial [Quaeritorhiza haematococci]
KQPKKRVVFHELVTVAFTWNQQDYDRTSIDVDPISRNDIIEIMALRQEFAKATAQLVKKRDEEEKRLLVLLQQQQQQQQLYHQQLLMQQQQQQQYIQRPRSASPALSDTDTVISDGSDLSSHYEDSNDYEWQLFRHHQQQQFYRQQPKTPNYASFDFASSGCPAADMVVASLFNDMDDDFDFMRSATTSSISKRAPSVSSTSSSTLLPPRYGMPAQPTQHMMMGY